MAPRKRKRDTRMAAALDNLKGYGFAETLIRKKINSFLKVYGDEGWQFIEEFSYKMVVDSICDDQEKESMLENNESMEVEVATESCSEPQPEPEPEPLPECEHHPEPELQLEPEPEPEPQPEPVQQKKQEVDNCHTLDPTLLLRIRKPCYGWICSDDEEDEILTLATEVSEMCTPELRKERKTRWDVKPKDM